MATSAAADDDEEERSQQLAVGAAATTAAAGVGRRRKQSESCRDEAAALARRNKIKNTGLNGGYWDVIGVRGVVREKLEKQETLEKGQVVEPTQAKRRKLSKTDSVESTGSSSSGSSSRRNSTSTAATTGSSSSKDDLPVANGRAKRKLTKSDSLDSNVSSVGGSSSTDSGSCGDNNSCLWEEDGGGDVSPVTEVRSQKRSLTAGGGARKRQKVVKGRASSSAAASDQQLAMMLLPLRFQYDFEANTDSDCDPKPGCDEDETVQPVGGLAETLTQPGSGAIEDLLNSGAVNECKTIRGSGEEGSVPSGDGQPVDQLQQQDDLVDTLSAVVGSFNVDETPVKAARELVRIGSAALESGGREKSDLPVDAPALPDPNAAHVEPVASVKGEKSPPAPPAAADQVDEEDLNSSRDSDDVWAAFRLKDEILEDNTEIWASTMDIFKSMEDMFTNSNKEEEEAAKKNEPDPELVVPGKQPERTEAAAAPVRHHEINCEESKPTGPADVSRRSRCEEKEEECKSVISTCSRRDKYQKRDSELSGSRGKQAASNIIERLNYNSDLKTAPTAGRQTVPVAGGAAAAAATATATVPVRSGDSPRRVPQPPPPRQGGTPTSRVKLIEPAQLDPERVERQPKTKPGSSSSSRQLSAGRAAEASKPTAGSRRPAGGAKSSTSSSSRGNSSRPQQQQQPQLGTATVVGTKTANTKMPSASQSKEKLLNFLDREYEKELSKSRQVRK